MQKKKVLHRRQRDPHQKQYGEGEEDINTYKVDFLKVDI